MAKNRGTASLSTGQIIEFGSAVLRQLPRVLEGVDPATIQKLIDKQDLLAQLLKSALTGTDPDVYSLNVQYWRTVEEMVSGGCYNYTNSYINSSNFPHDCSHPTDNVEAVLVSFDRTMSTDEVLCELKERGLRPANMPELLAFSDSYPEVQPESIVAALGSTSLDSKGALRIVCLYGVPKRYLFLDWAVQNWDTHYRFLAIR